MLFRNIFFGGLLLMVPCPVFAGTIGDSHNSINAVGRNRANVVYNQAKVATQITTQQPVVQYDAPATQSETVEKAPNAPALQVAPQPEPAPDLTAEIAMATEYIARLQNEIKQIDSEMARCRSAKTNWTIGTVIGGAGVVGTATGAIVQTVQINKAKKNGATESSDLKSDTVNNTKESE